MEWPKMALLLLLLGLLAGSRATPKSGRGRGSMWWGLAKAGEPNNLSPMTPGVLYMDTSVHSTLLKKQKNLAKENPGVLEAVAKGAKQAIVECEHQFRNRRWNCSTNSGQRGKNLFGKIVEKGCRETAFIYAIMSAAVTHAVARACSEGTIESCTCDYSHHGVRPQVLQHADTTDVVRDWEWGGCSDNIGYGFSFGREFVDTGERGRSARVKMNLHNNEAGRAHVRAEMWQECKCHGMSGSCTVKTCWMRLPNFRVIGDKLKDRFDGASRVLVASASHARSSNAIRKRSHAALGLGAGGEPLSGNSIHEAGAASLQRRKHHHLGGGRGAGHRRRKYSFKLKPYEPDHKPPEELDLVYVDKSPDFCKRDPRLGISGTHGRQCNNTSIGVDGCDLMCCGRKYKTQEVVAVERCSCVFHWCCEVQCKTCTTKRTIHTCL